MNFSSIVQLYHDYAEELREFESYIVDARKLYDLDPQFDDIERDITYMRLRELKPKNIIEFSPCNGYSTICMAYAVRKNGCGHITTYDIRNLCTNNFSALKVDDLITFVDGDVTTHFEHMNNIDYLFIDSDHSPEFAQVYVERLLRRIFDEKHVSGSCHDVYHTWGHGRALDAFCDHPSEEGVVIQSFFEEKGIEWWTPHYDVFELIKVRESLGLNQIHEARDNSAIFF